MTDLGKVLGARLLIEAMTQPTRKERTVKYVLGFAMNAVGAFLLALWWAGS